MSNVLTDFHFIRPIWLLLTLPAAVIWLLWLRHADPLRGWRKQIDPTLLDALTLKGGKRQRSELWLLVFWLLAVVAVAGPTWQREPRPFADDAAPLLIVLKADASMKQQDLEPTRLERARLKIADLAEARKGQPLGLIAYAGSAHTVLPPTRDTTVVAQMAAEIDPEVMPVAGDRLDLALQEAAKLLSGIGQGGSIVVLADSVDTEPAALQAFRKASSIPIQFLAVNAPGSSEEASLQGAAQLLAADLEVMSIDNSDVEAVVRRAAKTPQAQSGEGGERWQEAGYWLTPVLALFTLASFRRES